MNLLFVVAFLVHIKKNYVTLKSFMKIFFLSTMLKTTTSPFLFFFLSLFFFLYLIIFFSFLFFKDKEIKINFFCSFYVLKFLLKERFLCNLKLASIKIDLFVVLHQCHFIFFKLQWNPIETISAMFRH